MKITSVKAILLSYKVPKERQHRNDYGVIQKHDNVIVKVETDEGITGIGSAHGEAEAIKAIVEHEFQPALVGEDPVGMDVVAQVRPADDPQGTDRVGVFAGREVEARLELRGRARQPPAGMVHPERASPDGGRVRSKARGDRVRERDGRIAHRDDAQPGLALRGGHDDPRRPGNGDRVGVHQAQAVGHDQFAAEILRPYLREEVVWTVAHHGTFQMYYYAHHHGWNQHEREKYRDSVYYDSCVAFCERWDQSSFDPGYRSKDLSFFVPMVKEVFARRAYDPDAIRKGVVIGLPPLSDEGA